MSRSNIAMRAAARIAEAQVSRYRGAAQEVESDDAEKRPDVTSLIIEAENAMVALESDLEVLRERLAPVIDRNLKAHGEGSEEEGESAAAPAITHLERLVLRIETASKAVRFLTCNARI